MVNSTILHFSSVVFGRHHVLLYDCSLFLKVFGNLPDPDNKCNKLRIHDWSVLISDDTFLLLLKLTLSIICERLYNAKNLSNNALKTMF